jgi:DNA polymerase-3 subunit epsilon
MTDLRKETFICLDCETTGLDTEKDKIIEIAVVKFTFSEHLAEFESLVDPECPVPEESLRIHHISTEMLQGKPKIKEVMPEILKLVGSSMIVGHGIAFDVTMIAKAARANQIMTTIEKNQQIDTLRLARSYGESPVNSLEQLASHFNVPIIETHRAMADVLLNIAVFKHLVARFKTTDQIFKLLASPIRMKCMPLGKHKGRPFSEIPLEYLQWAAKMDFDQDLLFSIRLELKERKTGGRFTQAANPFSQL